MAYERCNWAGRDPLMRAYHDREWGTLVYDDRMLFEFLILEGMQAGLSWLTILKKRDAFREAFDGFDPGKIARSYRSRRNSAASATTSGDCWTVRRPIASTVA